MAPFLEGAQGPHWMWEREGPDPPNGIGCNPFTWRHADCHFCRTSSVLLTGEGPGAPLLRYARTGRTAGAGRRVQRSFYFWVGGVHRDWLWIYPGEGTVNTITYRGAGSGGFLSADPPPPPHQGCGEEALVITNMGIRCFGGSPLYQSPPPMLKACSLLWFRRGEWLFYTFSCQQRTPLTAD